MVIKGNAVTADLLGIAELKAIVVSGGLLVIKEIEDPKVNQESKVNGD